MSRFRAFCCKAFAYFTSERREIEKTTPLAWEAIYLGLTETKQELMDILRTREVRPTNHQSREIRRTRVPVKENVDY